VAGVATLGDVGVIHVTGVFVSGVSATGFVDTATTVAGCKVFPVGVQATAIITTPLVWSEINDTQTPDWQAVDDAQAGVWTAVNDNQTPNWQAVDDAQADSWMQIADGSTVVWTQIPT
jgi:hypothetical protein